MGLRSRALGHWRLSFRTISGIKAAERGWSRGEVFGAPRLSVNGRDSHKFVGGVMASCRRPARATQGSEEPHRQISVRVRRLHNYTVLCEAPVRPSGHSTAIRTGDEQATPKSTFATNRPGWPCELSGHGGQVDHRISTIAVEIPSRTSPTRSRTAVSEVDTPNPFDSDAEDTSTTTPEPSGLNRVLTDSPSTTRPSSWSCSQISCTKTAISVMPIAVMRP